MLFILDVYSVNEISFDIVVYRRLPYRSTSLHHIAYSIPVPYTQTIHVRGNIGLKLYHVLDDRANLSQIHKMGKFESMKYIKSLNL